MDAEERQQRELMAELDAFGPPVIESKQQRALDYYRQVKGITWESPLADHHDC